MSLFNFIKQHIIEVVNIYISENNRLGTGLLHIFKVNDKIKMDYLNLSRIYTKELKMDLNYKIMSIQGVENFSVNNMLIINMPSISNNSIIRKPIPIYLLINYENEDIITQGIPQPKNETETNYIFIMDPPKSIKKDTYSTWTVAETIAGSKYINSCIKAYKYDYHFENFRNDPDFKEINTQGSIADIPQYYQLLKSFIIDNPQWSCVYQENDIFGNPELHQFGNIDKYSIENMRYINILYTITKKFNNMPKNPSICEIGCGFGGLCKIIIDTLKPSSYMAVDTKEIINLTKKYLNNFKHYNEIRYVDNIEIFKLNKKENYDLIISEFSLCELNEENIEKYITYILSNSSNAYISTNFIDKNRNIWFINKLKQIYHNIEELDYLPKGEWDKKILICSN